MLERIIKKHIIKRDKCKGLTIVAMSERIYPVKVTTHITRIAHLKWVIQEQEIEKISCQKS